MRLDEPSVLGGRESVCSRWRTLFWIAIIPGILLIIGMQFAVESPRWLSKVLLFFCKSDYSVVESQAIKLDIYF